MKLETFFEKFDQFADAPDAVAKMRELVLELAVQGKLSDHRAIDSKDPAWLKVVEQLDADSNASSSDIEPPFVIPSWWRWTTLERLGDTKPRNDAPDSAKSSFVPMTLIPAEYGQSARHEERPWGEIKKGYTHFQDGDVVMAKITPCFENGKSAVMNSLTGGFGAGTTELHVFRRTGEAVLPEFVILYLKTRGFITRGIPRMTGSAGQKRVPSDYFARSPFPLPPLAEQKRIVAKVDELMALCDRLEAQQQERETRHAALARASLARFADAPTPANLPFLFHPSYAIPPADLRKSILTLAVQGKLMHRIESEGSGSDILEKAGVSVEQPDDVPDLPAHWVWTRLGSIATRMDSGWSPACIPGPAAKDEWGVLKTTAVQTLQYQEVQNKALPPNLEPRPEHEVMDGDILFTRAGPMNRVGILCVARPTRKKLMISDKIIRFHLVPGIDPDFAALSMNAGYSSSVVEGLKSGMAASQVNISQPKLRSVPIPIPPLAEQRRIVDKVEQLMALVDALETQLAASRATATNLLSALVAELTIQG